MVALGLITCRKVSQPSLAVASLMSSGTKPRAGKHYYRLQSIMLVLPSKVIAIRTGDKWDSHFLSHMEGEISRIILIPQFKTKTTRTNSTFDEYLGLMFVNRGFENPFCQFNISFLHILSVVREMFTS